MGFFGASKKKKKGQPPPQAAAPAAAPADTPKPHAPPPPARTVVMSPPPVHEPVMDNAEQTKQLHSAMKEVKTLRVELGALKRSVASSAVVSNELLATSMSQWKPVEEMLQRGMLFDKMKQQNRLMFYQLQELRGSIRVYCRIRPSLKPGEQVAACSSDGAMGLDQVEVIDKQRQWKAFTFDRVFGPHTSQAEMYEELAPLVRGVMDGHSACVFAYGQTSSGKTYTMSGPTDQKRTEQMHGLQYRALHDLFKQAEERTNTQYTVSVQMLEIYNDQLRDLLVDVRRANDLKLVDGVVNTRSVEVHNTMDVLKVMEEGERNRSTGSTALNVSSSRSHSVTTVVVEGRDVDTGEGYRAKLQLVDLAGSERVSHSQVEGERLKEAQYINRSLSSLGDVVSALQNKNQHVPYRNSRLTQVLQDSMGGTAKMVMLLHISPEQASAQESLGTCAFGVRAASVERSAPVKASLAAPMNTNQMKAAMEDLATKARDLEDREAELRASRSLADQREKQLTSKNRETVALEGDLSQSRIELATVKRELDKMRQKVIRSGAEPGPELAPSGSRVNSRPTSRVGSRSTSRPTSPGPTSRRNTVGPETALELMSRRTSASPSVGKATRQSVDSSSAVLRQANSAWGRSPATGRALPATAWGVRPSTAEERGRSTSRRGDTEVTLHGGKGVSALDPAVAAAARVRVISSSGPRGFGFGLNSARNHRATSAPPKRTEATPVRPTKLIRPSTGSVQSKFLSRGSSREASPAAPSAWSRGRPKSPQRVEPRRSAGNTERQEALSRLSRPKAASAATTDARYQGAHSQGDASRGGAVGGCSEAAVTADSAAASEAAARRLEDMQLERRKAEETRLRKEKLAKMARSGGESKITKITDFNSLLEEAENQLDRIAGGATMAEGDVRDDAAFASVDAIAKKIDKMDDDLNSNGAMSGKDEGARTGGIKGLNRLIGELESDDIASTDVESRIEKTRQIKRCRNLISQLEMAAMTTQWSSPWG